jgi:hypothetical protein
MRFVGVLPYKHELFTPTSIPTAFRESKLEAAFFSDVQFFSISHPDSSSNDQVPKYLVYR